jgi:sarcosine oxidase subunit gamma
LADAHPQLQGALDELAAAARSIPAAALARLPGTAAFIFRGREAAIERMGAAFGVALPREACRFAAPGGRTAFWLGPDEWLLDAGNEAPETVFASVERELGTLPHSLVDVSHRSARIAITGPRSAYVLNHGCPLDLSLKAFPVGMCTRTIYGKATIMLWRPEEYAFRLDVGRSFAPYVWKLLDEARSELA